MNYDFNKVIDRTQSNTCKYGMLAQEFGRTDLTPLWIADMDFEVCPAITEAIMQRIGEHRIYGYTMPSQAYWQSIIHWQQKRNGFTIAPDEITFIPGIVKGVALAVNFFTKPGDKIVIQEPVYHPFRRVAAGNNRRVVVNNLLRTADGFYAMNLEELERIFREHEPKMMILCNPHNPIGIAWDKATLCQVAKLAREYHVIVVSDEIHGDLMLYGHRHVAFASVSDDAAAVSVTFGAPSKTFNIAGIVSSWCVVKNPDLRNPFFSWLDTNEFNEVNFVSTVATQAAYENGEEWLTQCIAYIEANIAHVEDFCKNHLPGIKAIRPQSSFLVWLDCTGLGLPHDKLIDLFVNKAHLALNDGLMFGKAGEGFMRLNVATPRSVLTHALEQLKAALASA